ncbi:hypothetical protein AALD01_09765 [Oscillospiraceae bacterium 21-37]
MTKAEAAFMELAYQIKKFLVERGMKAGELAAKCRVKPATLEKAMGEKKIPTKDMQKNCSTLGLSLDSLRHIPRSGSFEKLQLFVLDMASSRSEAQLNESEIRELLQGLPPYEQSRNLRWLRQAIEHPEFYGLQNQCLPPNPARKRIFLRTLLPHPLPSPVCFTRKISKKKAEKLKQLIEDSKKK